MGICAARSKPAKFSEDFCGDWTEPNLTLKLPAEATGAHMPADIIGLSYEVQQLTDAAFFSGRNAGLIRQCKAQLENLD